MLRNTLYRSLIWATVVENHESFVGFDVNSVLKCGWTGLMYAANSANIQIVDFLLSKGSNVKSHYGM